jgi:hypothetical protein
MALLTRQLIINPTEYMSRADFENINKAPDATAKSTITKNENSSNELMTANNSQITSSNAGGTSSSVVLNANNASANTTNTNQTVEAKNENENIDFIVTHL